MDNWYTCKKERKTHTRNPKAKFFRNPCVPPNYNLSRGAERIVYSAWVVLWPRATF
jgi:hypothetical protein